MNIKVRKPDKLDREYEISSSSFAEVSLNICFKNTDNPEDVFKIIIHKENFMEIFAKAVNGFVLAINN